MIVFLMCLLHVANVNAETILYSSPTSSSSLRVRIILQYKGIPFSVCNVDKEEIAGSAYKNLNPQGKVPTLIIDGHVMTQTMAIAEYLEETRPTCSLLPKDAILRSRVRQICQIIASDIQPLQNLAIIEHLPAEKRCSWAKSWIEKGLAAIEKIVSDTCGPYTMGTDFTLADVFLYPQLRNAHLFNVDLNKFPSLMKIEKNLSTHLAITDALDD